MPTAEKEQKVADLREVIKASNAAILTDYRGLSVADLTSLRRKLRAVDAEFHIVKNTLFKRASDGLIEQEGFVQHLEGPTAIGFAKGDAVAASKAILDYIKDHKGMSVKAGVVEGRIVNAAQIAAISKLPAKEVIIAQILGSLNAPASNLVGTLNGIISDFVFTIQAVADKKAAEA
ncbi:MAG: 50S ribosomal protein L10 [Capsulimonadaceae bacterium]|nr:50S ribosomal protein L10 [Capsulimonadaceae bacterium]